MFRPLSDEIQKSPPQLVLESVRQLRKWKKASSVTKVCERMEREFGKSHEETSRLIGGLIFQGSLIQVKHFHCMSQFSISSKFSTLYYLV